MIIRIDEILEDVQWWINWWCVMMS